MGAYCFGRSSLNLLILKDIFYYYLLFRMFLKYTFVRIKK